MPLCRPARAPALRLEFHGVLARSWAGQRRVGSHGWDARAQAWRLGAPELRASRDA